MGSTAPGTSGHVYETHVFAMVAGICCKSRRFPSYTVVVSHGERQTSQFFALAYGFTNCGLMWQDVKISWLRGPSCCDVRVVNPATF
jgi:hypothetical protein